MKGKTPILITPFSSTILYSNNPFKENEDLQDVITRMLRLKRELGREVYTYFNNVLISTEYGDDVETIEDRYSDDMYNKKKFAEVVFTTGDIQTVPHELMAERDVKGDSIYTLAVEGTYIDVRDCKTEEDILDKYIDSTNYGSVGYYKRILKDEDKKIDSLHGFLKERKKNVLTIARILSSGNELVDDNDIAKITFSAATGEIIKTVEYKVPQYDSEGNIIAAGTLKVLAGKDAILDLLTEENVEWFTATSEFEQKTEIELDPETQEAIHNYILKLDTLITSRAKLKTNEDTGQAIHLVIEELKEEKEFPAMNDSLTVEYERPSQKEQIKEVASSLRIASFFSFLESLNEKIRGNDGKGGRQ